MIDARIEVTDNRFPAIADRFPQLVSAATGKALFDVVAQAAPRTPVDQGLLRSNVEVRFSPGAFSGEIVWGQGYAAYVHDGTALMAGRPFARQAFDAVAPGYLEALAQLEGQL